MKIYNVKDLICFESKINEISNKLNIKLDYNFISKNCMRVKLVKVKENKNYQRVGFCPNKDGSPRRVNAICWHGFNCQWISFISILRNEGTRSRPKVSRESKIH